MMEYKNMKIVKVKDLKNKMGITGKFTVKPKNNKHLAKVREIEEILN